MPEIQDLQLQETTYLCKQTTFSRYGLSKSRITINKGTRASFQRLFTNLLSPTILDKSVETF